MHTDDTMPEDLNLAKAAAQADYAARIRAALELPDHAALLRAALALPEVKRLVDAADRFELLSRDNGMYTQDEADELIEAVFAELRTAIAALKGAAE